MLLFKRLSLLLFSSLFITNVQAQIDIEYTPKLISKPNTGIVTMAHNSDVLTCGVTETISYLACGANSVLLPGGGCEVEPNETFSIDYQVNNVESCTGTGGTSSWRGGLAPFAGGSGSYSKVIPGGIADDVDFTLNCVPRLTRYNFSQINKASIVELNELYKSANDLINTNKLLSFNFNNEKFSTKDHIFDESYKAHDGQMAVMIRQSGSDLYFIPTPDYQPVSIKKFRNDNDIDRDKYSIFVTIVSELPETFESIIPIDESKSCNSLGNINSEVSINIKDDDASEDVCSLNWSKSQHLIWYVLENSPQINIVSQR